MACLLGLLAHGAAWALGRGDRPPTLGRAIVVSLLLYARGFAVLAAIVFGSAFAIAAALDHLKVGLDHPNVSAFLRHALDLRSELDQIDKGLVYLAGALFALASVALISRAGRRVPMPEGLSAADAARHLRKGTKWLGRALAILFFVGMLAAANDDFAKRLDEVAVNAVMTKADATRTALGLARDPSRPKISADAPPSPATGATASAPSRQRDGTADDDCEYDADRDVCAAIVRAAGRAGSDFERGFTSGFFGPPDGNPPPPPKSSGAAAIPPVETAKAIERAAARKSILDRYAAVAPKSANVASVPASTAPPKRVVIKIDEAAARTVVPDDADGRDSLAAAARELATGSVPGTRPVTEVGRRFERDVLALASGMDRPRKEALIASFPEKPAPTPDRSPRPGDLDAQKLFVGELVKRMIDRALELTGIPDTHIQVELAKGAVQAASDRLTDAYLPVAMKVLAKLNDRWSAASPAEVRVASEAAEAASGRIMPHDERRGAESVAMALPDNVAIRLHGEKRPPALEHTKAETLPFLGRLWSLRERLASAGFSVADIAKAAGVYEDVLPHRSADVERSSQGDLETSAGREAAGKSRADRSAIASDFERSRRHNAVGGVVFGRPPTAASPIDATGLDWAIAGNGIELSVSLRDGSSVSLGSFPAETLATALAFAADGRVTAVTIQGSEGLHLQRVHLHPALVDTGIGCRLIAADRWLFDWMEEDPELEGKHKAVSASHRNGLAALTVARNFLIAAYLAHLRGVDPTSHVDAMEKEYAPYMRWQPHEPGLPEDVRAVAATIWRGDLDDGRRRIRDTAEACIAERTTDSIRRCYTARAAGHAREALATPYLRQLRRPRTTSDDVARLRIELPEVAAVSGVRESEYKLDATLSSLRPAGDPLASIRFLLLGNFDQIRFADTQLEYGPDVQRLVDGLVRRKFADAEIQAAGLDVERFIVAQRLFRSALGGDLGQSFPLSRLVALAELVNRREGDAATPTARWVDRAGTGYREEVARALDRLETTPAFREQAALCARAIRAAAENWLADPQVERACTIGPSPGEVTRACRSGSDAPGCADAKRAFEAGTILERAKARAAVLARDPPPNACSPLVAVRGRP